MFITISAAVAGFFLNRFIHAGGRHELHGFECPSFGNTVSAAFASTRGDDARGFFVLARTAVPILVRTQPNVGLGATIFTQAAVLSIVGVTGTSRLGLDNTSHFRAAVRSIAVLVFSLVAVTFGVQVIVCRIPARSSLTSELLVGGSESFTCSGSFLGRLEAGQWLVIVRV